MRNIGWLTVTVMLLLLAGPAAMAQDAPKAEVFGGYSYVRSGGSNLSGWNAAVAGNLNNWFGVVGDFSGHYSSGFRLHTYTFGPQFSYRWGSAVVPFAHALFGGARASGGGFGVNGFASHYGGGIDWLASDRFAIRLVQGDLRLTRFSGNTALDPRLSFGVVFRFGM